MAQIKLDSFEIAQMFGLQFLEYSEPKDGCAEVWYRFQFHDYYFTHSDFGHKTEDEMMEQAGKAVLYAVGFKVAEMLK